MKNKRQKASKKIKKVPVSQRGIGSKPFGVGKILEIATCIFLVISTFAVYGQVQDHDFLNLDDPVYVSHNSMVQAEFTLESVVWAFTTSLDGNWFPVTWLSHILDYQLYGLNPQGHHLTNLFFHIVNALLLFLVLSRMTGALWQSGFVAAMFALHPVNAESVAWISERKNVLSTFFWILTIWAYMRYAQKKNIKRYMLVGILFALGLMSKPMLVTLPFVLLLLDYWPLGRFQLKNKTTKLIQRENHTALSRLILEKFPLFILSAGSCITTIIAQRSNGAVESLDLISLETRIINALVSYFRYLETMVWPNRLAIIYPHPGNALPAWQGVFFGVILVCITIAVIQRVRQMPYLAVGWFWYLGTLVPVIGLVQVGFIAMADRYMYIPLIGIFIMIAWGLPQLVAKWHHRNKVLTLAAGIWVTALMVLTWVQVGHWKSSITIFEHAIKVTDKKYPNFAPVHDNLGIALHQQGKTEEAISNFRTAIALQPKYPLPHSNLGLALFRKGAINEAISQYKIAVKIKPDFEQAHSNLGSALLYKGKVKEAISQYKIAIKIKPNYAASHSNLGNALLAEGRTEEAISQYKMAIKLNPDLAEAYNNLGHVFYKNQMTEKAITHYRKAIELKPGFKKALQNLNTALLKLKK
jgi:protein O-mannosyl-transferase